MVITLIIEFASHLVLVKNRIIESIYKNLYDIRDYNKTSIMAGQDYNYSFYILFTKEIKPFTFVLRMNLLQNYYLMLL